MSVLLVTSFLSSACLQHLGHYFTLYSWTKKLSPIIHISLIHDFMRNSEKLSETIEAEMEIILREGRAELDGGKPAGSATA